MEEATTSASVQPFIGEFDLTVDAKNRLSIPADVRRSIPETDGEGAIITYGDEIPCIYTAKYFYALVNEQIPKSLAPSREVDDFDRLTSGMAHRVEWDKQGRIVLPEHVLEHGQWSREITLVGRRDHLEIWDRGRWKDRRRALYEFRQTIRDNFTKYKAGQVGNQSGQVKP